MWEKEGPYKRLCQGCGAGVSVEGMKWEGRGVDGDRAGGGDTGERRL